MNPTHRLTALVLWLALSVAACSPAPTSASAGAPTPADTPVPADMLAPVTEAASTTAAPTLGPVAGQYLFTEGPAVDAQGRVYFSDITAGTLYQWTPAGAVTVFKTGLNGPNGLAFDAAGRLIVCEGGAGRLIALDPDGQITVLVDQYAGQRFNEPNDLWLDAQGGIYFTDPAYQSPVVQDREAVYYLAPDGQTVTRVIDDLVRPNGIAGTADGQTLYVADHGAGQVWAYTLTAGGGVSAPRLFAAASADGLAADAQGNVYLAGPQQVEVYSAAGQLLRAIAIPEAPTNLAFAGADGQTLFITARTAAYTLPLTASAVPAPATDAATADFVLTSPALGADGRLPTEFTCDGASATLPLMWSGAPTGTQSFAVVMHHAASPTDIHWYWVLYNLPPEVTALAMNTAGLGTLGTNSVNGRRQYSPPCSKGPGDKTYIYTVYALSAAPQFAVPAEQVDRAALLDAMAGIILASAELPVVYARK